MNTSLHNPLTMLRDRNTSCTQFRNAADQIIQTLADSVYTQLHTTQAGNRPVTLVPILRSGIAMLPAFLHTFAHASVGMIGIKRDETTARADLYYCNIPPAQHNSYAIILDPMLATGGTAHRAITQLIAKGYRQKNIIFVGILSAPEGINLLATQFPSITIIVAQQDPALDEHKFIVPGLGDFGDRYFDTQK